MKLKHKYAFKFKNSKRSREHNSGIDYSKMVIIKNTDYIGKYGIIDRDEEKEEFNNINQIVTEAISYLEIYINYQTGTENKIGKNKFSKMYKCSTLKYFHRELNLKQP